jgi:hypothetical protein
MFLTKEQIGGISRAVLGSGFGYAIGKGWIPAGDYETVIGGVSVALVGLWSIWTNRPAVLAPKA